MSLLQFTVLGGQQKAPSEDQGDGTSAGQRSDSHSNESSDDVSPMRSWRIKKDTKLTK